MRGEEKMKKAEVDPFADIDFFAKRGAKLKDPKIIIMENSIFLFNAAFIHLAALNKSTHVILGYAPVKKIIVFQFTCDDMAEGAYKLVHRPGGTTVGGKGFLQLLLPRQPRTTGALSTQ
jgi:hypothetical protein